MTEAHSFNWEEKALTYSQTEKEWALSKPIVIVTEAPSIEALRAKLPGMILDLLEETGVSDLPAAIEIIPRLPSL